MTADWRDIPGYPGYQASDDGRVRSVDRVIVDSIGRSRRLRGVELATFADDQGYLRCSMPTQQFVHRMICLAFNGAPGDGLHAAHRDGDKQNNEPSNLYWATVAENNRDVIRHGRHHNANKTHCKRGHELTPENLVRQEGRACRECHRDRCRSYRERNPEKVRATKRASEQRRRKANA